jgi:RimJ/RimL family protein N-acetyltransferase
MAAIPSGLTHQRFVATPLTTDLMELDYAAYMDSPDVIREHSDGRWPVAGFTLAEDAVQIAQHEAEHRAGKAFTFALLDHAMSESLGCLYLNPLHAYLDRAGADPTTIDTWPPDTAMVTFWIRQDLQGSYLPPDVVTAVSAWLADCWPFAAHVFRVLPGERASVAALDAAGLHRVALQLTRETRPYLWYRPG